MPTALNTYSDYVVHTSLKERVKLYKRKINPIETRNLNASSALENYTPANASGNSFFIGGGSAVESQMKAKT